MRAGRFCWTDRLFTIYKILINTRNRNQCWKCCIQGTFLLHIFFLQAGYTGYLPHHLVCFQHSSFHSFLHLNFLQIKASPIVFLFHFPHLLLLFPLQFQCTLSAFSAVNFYLSVLRCIPIPLLVKDFC